MEVKVSSFILYDDDDMQCGTVEKCGDGWRVVYGRDLFRRWQGIEWVPEKGDILGAAEKAKAKLQRIMALREELANLERDPRA